MHSVGSVFQHSVDVNLIYAACSKEIDEYLEPESFVFGLDVVESATHAADGQESTYAERAWEHPRHTLPVARNIALWP